MATGMTADGLNYLGYALVSGGYLGLGTDANTEVSGNNYARVSCAWGASSSENTAYFSASGGVLTNQNRFYFPEADDTTGATQTGWGTVTHLFIINNGVKMYKGALTSPVNVTQDVQLRFDAGSIKITFLCVTVAE